MSHFSIQRIVLFLSFIALFTSIQLRADILSKRYNDVSFITAHNGQSHKKHTLLSFLPGSNISNQSWSLQEQLDHGIRSVKIPIHNYLGETYACHGLSPGDRSWIKRVLCPNFLFLQPVCDKVLDDLNPCLLDPATIPMTNILATVREFLQNHPEEVFTLFIEDKTNDLQRLADLFENSGLAPLAYKQSQDLPWPSLKEMILKNQRLVIFVSSDQDAFGNRLEQYPFFNSKEFFIAESRYNFRSILALEKDSFMAEDEERFSKLEKHDPDNKIWVLQHFVTPSLGGASDSAKIVNQWPFLNRRIKKYESRLGKHPNFIWLDFITDAEMANVQSLNLE